MTGEQVDGDVNRLQIAGQAIRSQEEEIKADHKSQREV